METATTNSFQRGAGKFGARQKNVTNLIKLQKEAIESVLTAPRREEETDQCLWKVLIFDSYCKNMLSTVMPVSSLHELNITLHLHINNKSEKRDKLHGVKAYYLVEPTRENFAHIMDDFTHDLYDQVYIHFSSPADPEFLKQLAVHIGTQNAVYKIKRIVQHSINFVTMTPNLFTLGISNSYSSLRTFESAAWTKTVQRAAIGLFSLFRTMKKVPLIFYQSDERKNTALAQELVNLFDKFYVNSKEYEEEQSDFITQQMSSPILILAERDTDFGSQLLHPYNYGGLIHDVFQIEGNRVKYKESETSTAEFKLFDLDYDSEDSFWVSKVNEPFPDVATEVSNRTSQWEIEKKQMMLLKDDLKKMAAEIDNMNAMNSRKRLLEVHMSLSRGILNELQQRHIDKYYEFGISIMRDKTLTEMEKNEILSIFKDTSSTNLAGSNTGGKNQVKVDLDKLRILLIILIVAGESSNHEDFEELKVAAEISNKKYLAILDQFKALYMPQQPGSKEVLAAVSAAAAAGGDGTDVLGERLGGLLGKIASKVKSKGKGLLKNVKNYLPGQEYDFPVAMAVKNLLESKLAAYDKLGYRFVDVLHKQNRPTPPKSFSDVVVFVPDGGNFNEYSNLQEVAKKLNKTIIYGGSEILNSDSFIQQLSSSS